MLWLPLRQANQQKMNFWLNESVFEQGPFYLSQVIFFNPDTSVSIRIYLTMALKLFDDDCSPFGKKLLQARIRLFRSPSFVYEAHFRVISQSFTQISENQSKIDLLATQVAFHEGTPGAQDMILSTESNLMIIYHR
jgi:hypothetical protein